MDRNGIIEYLQPDWDAVVDLLHTYLHSDVKLLESINDSVLSRSGKMMRPMLSLLMGKALSPDGKLNADNLNCAVTSELLHNATLMHDDVADKSPERRGAPTLMSVLGPAAAVLVGDYWLAKSVTALIHCGCRAEVEPIFARTLSELAEGEMLQMEKAGSADADEDDYLRVIHCKTASLFVAACESAAVAVNASAELREAARCYASSLGMAFQIKDDIMDYTGTSEMGKPAGVDLKEQKITMPLFGAMQNSGREDEIRSMLKEMDTHPEHADTIHAIVMENGGIGYASQRLEEYIEQAVRALDAVADGPAKGYLVELARFNSIRKV